MRFDRASHGHSLLSLRGRRAKEDTMDRIWREVSPWLFAALISSLIPLGLLLLFSRYPEIESLLIGDEAKHPYNFLVPFGTLRPLTKTSLAFALWTTGIYWGLGYVLYTSPLPESSGWRFKSAQIFWILAVGGLFIIVPLLVTIWTLGIKGDFIPSGPWGVFEGNHGPWRGIYDLRKLLYYTMHLPAASFILGFLSLILRATKLAGIALLSSILTLFGLIASHYWLID